MAEIFLVQQDLEGLSLSFESFMNYKSQPTSLYQNFRSKEAIMFKGRRTSFCRDFGLRLIGVACLSYSLVGGQEQFDQSTATAGLSTSWTLSKSSAHAEWFNDGSFLLPILHMEIYGFGFYMKVEIPGNYFLAVFILPCYDYDLTSTPGPGCTPQLVWSPNRNSPVEMGSTLELDSGGDLVLKDADRTVVWSTNTSDSISIPRTISGQYMKFCSDGHLRVYQWLADEWIEAVDLMTERVGECGYPFVCGRYGICSNRRQCRCPPSSNQNVYFKPMSDKHPELGCSEISPLSCGASQNNSFLELRGITYFDSGWSLQNVTGEICKEACAKNCSCKAAIFHPETDSDKYSYCSLLYEVFSLMDNDIEKAGYSSIAYIKVQGIPNQVLASSPKKNTSHRPLGHANRLLVILGSCIGAVIILVGVVVSFVQKKKRANKGEDEEYLDQVPGMPSRFSYDDLKALTGNFGKKLGEGGFGSVFEGTLTDGMRVAVKHLQGLGHIKNSFLAEVKSIGSIHHINLVRLVGFCSEKSHRLLIYEYMANGSLEKWIFKTNEVVLSWQQRKKIILDIAKGLNYLLEECRQKIIHLDIKPQNILLDENYNAKVSDFGLSKLVDRDESQVVTTMRGTPGYLAPEWLSSVITEKVDVYSFGVVILETVCGRKLFDSSQDEEDRNLLNLLKRKAKEDRFLEMVDKDAVDQQLCEVEAVTIMKLAACCLQAEYTRRPSMSTIIKVLEGAIEVEDDLDYNFWTHSVRVRSKANTSGVTAQLLPSVLSGPR
ncbi:G-type lectin S-receptor-like serine/threonine-protein kinase SD2-5 [Punica granatum]|uniref:non-specific serine/threonine protein kinase n=1 Tax=Punica granatum TaxID=22663 RepID=A0A6P8C8G5_PUNGR|nr:G-type lectin S-receptor-like serine/threonine-protein kinase SD2-5 [Punica granatum]